MKGFIISFSTKLFIGLSLFFGYCELGYAYNFTSDFGRGSYWGSLPITINVADTQLYNLLKQAENAWEDSVGVEIWNIIKTSSLSGNYIRWSNDIAGETGYDPSYTLAVTARTTTNGVMSRVAILFNGSREDLRANSNNNLYKTVLHELGHTVGLGHSDHQAIMAPSISHLSHLQNDDVEGMDALLDMTFTRQEVGVSVSGLNAGDTSVATIGACGSLHLIDQDSNDPPSGGSGFIVSLFIGLFISMILGRFNPVNLRS